MTTIPLPPLPMHPEPHTYTWTALEAAAIERYRLAVAQAVREACERVAFQMPLQTTPEGNEYRASDDCKALAWDIAHAIRALKIEVNDANV